MEATDRHPNPMAVDEQPVTLSQLLEAGVHFGHQTTRWNPKMKPFIYGARNGIHIIDLQKTVGLFRKAFEFVRSTVAQGGTVLFVGTKKQAQDAVLEESTRCGMYSVTHRWLGGTLTNFRTVKGSIDRLRGIEKMAEDGTFERLTKKEVLHLTREREKLEKNLGGIKDMAKLPGVLYVVDPDKERIAIAEANKLEIPVVAVGDTNCDPDVIDYLIPGNDDAIRAIRLFTSRVADACLLGGRLARERAASRGMRDEGGPSEEPQTIHVTSGGDGPTVEVVSRRVKGSGGAPEASGRPEDKAAPEGDEA